MTGSVNCMSAMVCSVSKYRSNFREPAKVRETYYNFIVLRPLLFPLYGEVFFLR